MIWHNAVRDFLPNTSRSVLIAYRGVYHISFFNKERNDFTFSNGGVEKQIVSSDILYWADIDSIPPTKTKTVLIVEDDPDDQELISRELKRQMPDVIIELLSDGQEAINYLLNRGPYKGGTKKPDLILLDLNLPLVDGFGVLKEIAKHDDLKHSIVFVVSTSRSIDQWETALNHGARCFFNKGSSAEDLKKIVKEICANLT